MRADVSPVTAASAMNQTAVAPGRLVNGRWRQQLLTFLVVASPGLIVMEADNDVGAVSLIPSRERSMELVFSGYWPCAAI
jgi:hypothetical protein